MHTCEGHRRKRGHFFLRFQKSSCSAYSFHETYSFFQEVTLKHYLGMYWSVDIYNIVSPRQDDLRSNYYIGYCLQMSEALVRKLILTLCNLKINRNQQTISRLLVRVHWHCYWQFPWNLCTHRYSYCVYIPIIYGLSVPTTDAQSSHWLAQLLQSLITSLLWFRPIIITIPSQACTCSPWDIQGCTRSTQQPPFLTSASGANLLRKLIKSITRRQKKKRLLISCFSKTQNNIKYVCISVLN